jgi:hypothetical protein
MNKKHLIVAVLLIGLLAIAGCTSATGSVPRAPPAPSGGGCGIAAPSDASPEIGAAVEDVDSRAAL